MGGSSGGVWDETIIGEVSTKEIIDAFYCPTGANERWGNARINRCIPLIDPKPGEKILDLACGFGTFTYLCTKNGAFVIGIDLSEICMRAAIDACMQSGLENFRRFVYGDVTSLPFPDSSFDKLISIDGFEHFTWKQKQLLIEEAYRVLKPEGKFIVYTPNILTKATKVLRRNLINFFTGRFSHLTNTKDYLAVKEPTHIGMISPFKMRRLFKSRLFKSKFHYSTAYGKRKRSIWKILLHEKIPFFRDVLNGRIAVTAKRAR